jgi:hypothetical protein
MGVILMEEVVAMVRVLVEVVVVVGEVEEEEACTSDSDDSDGKASDSLSENTVLRQEAVRPPVAARPLPGSGSGSLESQAQRLSAQQRELSDEIQR